LAAYGFIRRSKTTRIFKYASGWRT